MPAADAHSLRQAALALHALSSEDMQRVWQRLDDTQRDTLSPLLDELDSLGIPKGRQWLDEGAQVAGIQAGQGLPEQVQDDVRRLSRLGAHQALALLTTQSLDTAIAVMQMAPWPWLAEVTENWPAEQRHAVRARLAQKQAHPRKLLAQMLKLMAQEAAMQAPVTRPASTGKAANKPAWYRSVMSLFLFM
ncbi:MAG: hypothetical protein QM749_11515 [Aquabacterium sp.]